MWLTYVLGPFLAALPSRWRRELFPNLPIRWERAAFLSGLLEVFLSLPLLVIWYALFVGMFRQAGGSAFGDRAGIVATIWFWLNPITWIGIYCSIEGVFRALGALFAGEARGMAAIALARYVYLRIRPHRGPGELPLVADEITPGDASCDMKIASCRKHPEWTYPHTIRYAGGYFQIVSHQNIGAGPRPHVYSLRRLPQGEIAGGLKEYLPEDVLLPTHRLERVGS